jgi:hypothetical protein
MSHTLQRESAETAPGPSELTRTEAKRVVFRMADDEHFATAVLDVLLTQFQFEIAVRDRLRVLDDLAQIEDGIPF